MKAERIITGLFVIAVLALGGCRKKAAQQTPPPWKLYGVPIDEPKLSMMLTNVGPEADAQLNQLQAALRQQAYGKAIMTLEKLANNPQLSDPQKQVVNQVIEEIKQAVKAKNEASQ
jgi:hypothetical protein